MMDLNVLGGTLDACCLDPVTGFYRDGSCSSGPDDLGSHTVCCYLTEGFLAYSKAQGNDLSTPRPEYNFPGLRAGDKWCVCASRWMQAAQDGQACPIILSSTHQKALEIIPLELLMEYAVDLIDY